jgi:hypothetical protein
MRRNRQANMMAAKAEKTKAVADADKVSRMIARNPARGGSGLEEIKIPGGRDDGSDLVIGHGLDPVTVSAKEFERAMAARDADGKVAIEAK